MHKIAVILLADTEAHESWGRMANAFETVKEFKEASDEVVLIFDGAGTKWPGKLIEPSHKYHRLYEQIADKVGGACAYCANAFGVKQELEAKGIRLLQDFDGHPSVRRFIHDGYQVLTF